MKTISLCILFLSCSLAFSQTALPPQTSGEPIGFEELLRQCRAGEIPQQILAGIEGRKLKFSPTDNQLADLKNTGCKADFLAALVRPQNILPKNVILALSEADRQKVEIENLRSQLQKANDLANYVVANETEENQTKRRLGVDKLESEVKAQNERLRRVEEILAQAMGATKPQR